MSKLEDAAYITPPLENSAAMKCIANIVVSNAGIVQGLSGLFGGTLADGHYITLQSDGAKIYVKFSGNSSSSIDAFATGTGTTVAWPVPDGMTLPVVPIFGKEVGTGIGLTAGIATTVRYDFLHARVASGGVATGYLRIYRNVGPGKEAGTLKAP